MDEISKKELLAETGISYGQLYRWKREGLIPEEWFDKRSSFTGQETWFPRKKVIERVNKIMAMKDERSLEEICEHLHNDDLNLPVREGIVKITELDSRFISGLNALSDVENLSIEKIAAICAIIKCGQEAGMRTKKLQQATNEAIELIKKCDFRIDQALMLVTQDDYSFVIEGVRGELWGSKNIIAAHKLSVSDYVEQLRSGNVENKQLQQSEGKKGK